MLEAASTGFFLNIGLHADFEIESFYPKKHRVFYMVG